jgi:hypothetical protein
MLKKIALLSFLFTSSAIISSAQNFGGIINFNKQTGSTPVTCVYYVKGDKVRFDEFKPGTKTAAESFIMDIKANTMIFIDPARKLWGTQKQVANSTAAAGCVASPVAATKDILGYKCTEQIVKNMTDSIQIDFFLAPGKFAFFAPMVKLINSHEKFSTYYFAMTVPDGSMPILAIQKDLKGVEKERMEVTKIESKVVADAMFAVPDGYTEMK